MLDQRLYRKFTCCQCSKEIFVPANKLKHIGIGSGFEVDIPEAWYAVFLEKEVRCFCSNPCLQNYFQKVPKNDKK